MHSSSQSRLAARCANANVSIGDRFKPEPIFPEKIRRETARFLMAHGGLDFSRDGRKRAMWSKWRAGLLPAATAARVLRDNRELFAQFDLEAESAK